MKSEDLKFVKDLFKQHGYRLSVLTNKDSYITCEISVTGIYVESISMIHRRLKERFGIMTVFEIFASDDKLKVKIAI